MMLSRFLCTLAVGAALAGLTHAQTGSANAPSVASDKAARTALEKRVMAYWTARKESDLGAAYAFYSPEFRAGKARPVFLRDFQRLIRFPPEKVRVEGVEFAEGRREAMVKVRLELTRNIEGQEVPMSGVTEETWVLVDRNWWKKDEPLVINY